MVVFCGGSILILVIDNGFGRCKFIIWLVDIFRVVLFDVVCVFKIFWNCVKLCFGLDLFFFWFVLFCVIFCRKVFDVGYELDVVVL